MKLIRYLDQLVLLTSLQEESSCIAMFCVELLPKSAIVKHTVTICVMTVMCAYT